MRKILIIEDSPSNLHLMETILNANGYAFESATTGEDGVEAAIGTAFDLILMDIQLPGIDGYEALRRIRAEANSTYLPIIAITGNTTQSDRERALRAGFDGFLTKPFRIDKLLETIINHFPGQ